MIVAHHIDLSEITAAAFCFSCGDAYREPGAACSRCGAPLVSRVRIEADFQASVAEPEEPVPALEGLDLLCVAHGEHLQTAVQTRLRTLAEPFFLLKEQPEGADPPSNGDSACFYLASQHVRWAKIELEDLFDGGASVLLVKAGDDTEAAAVRGALDAKGIAYSTIQFSRQYAIQYGSDAETGFHVLQVDLPDAQRALGELTEMATSGHEAEEGSLPESGGEPQSTTDDLEGMRAERRFLIARGFMYLGAAVNVATGILLFPTPATLSAILLVVFGITMVALARWSRTNPARAFGSALLLFGASLLLWSLTGGIAILPGGVFIIAVYFAYRRAVSLRQGGT